MSISDNFCSSCTDMIAEEMACAAEEIRVLEIRRGNRTTQVPGIQTANLELKEYGCSHFYRNEYNGIIFGVHDSYLDTKGVIYGYIYIYTVYSIIYNIVFLYHTIHITILYYMLYL